MANKKYSSCYSKALPLTDCADEIPTFNVQDICTGIGNCENDIDLSDEDADNDMPCNPSCVDLTQECPTVYLPILLLSKISMKYSETYGVLHSYNGMKGKVYERLPPYIREAVIITHQKNASMQEFFENSQWRAYLQLKRSTDVNKTSD